MKYLSVCSGIEAASVAWHPLGWEAVAFAEIDRFPSALLSHHYPAVPNWGDLTKCKDWPDATFDVLVGGTPCQSFSVAGLRKGLDDPRGNLTLTYLAVLDRYRPGWCVWENVPGVLSSGGGRDFGAFLGGLGQLGYGFAYRVLDAQYFGVAQRRRRVFVVGCLGGWQRAAAVLFDGESLCGHPAPRREAGQRPAGTLKGGTGERGYPDPSDGNGGGLVEVAGTLGGASQSGGFRTTDLDNNGAFVPVTAPCLTQNYGKQPDNSDTNAGPMLVTTLAIRGRGDSCDLECRTDGTANAILTPNGGRGGIGVGAIAFANTAGDTALGLSKPGVPPITGRNGDPGNVFQPGMAVRRLTPTECERLQGFPDGYTLVPYRGKPAADGNRYKALGNSMAVPVMAWIGKRLQIVNEIKSGCSL
jgi:DNA (cytosine-5)-methyltransferase 1